MRSIRNTAFVAMAFVVNGAVILFSIAVNADPIRASRERQRAAAQQQTR